jgi:DNA invertase Pin-like site-specific DNA recombinase
MMGLPDLAGPGQPGPETRLAAIYARISVNENGERDESLETQCDLLAGYAREKGLGETRLYVDNNESGTSFNRPGLLRLVDDIKSGQVGVVAVKDLSRLGRNNGETLTFLDFLAENGVRLLSLVDNYDSGTDDDEIIGIKTWVNEHYARDISKKVRANLKKKMRDGEHLARPHFGYLKPGAGKNRLVVDERYRSVIQKLFDLYIQGRGYRALAEYLQRLGIPTPSQDKNYPGAKKTDCWNEQQVRRIITSRVYCGDTVQGMTEKISFKSKKVRRLPPERWVVVENTHEPLVSRETFALAQQIRVKRWREGNGRKKKMENGLHPYTGFLVCAACGSHLVYRKAQNRQARYRCGRYEKFGRKEDGCTAHTVLEEILSNYLITDLSRLAGERSLQHRLADEYRQRHRCSFAGAAGELKSWVARLAVKRRQLKTTYLDKLKGLISTELFAEASAEIEREAAILEAGINRLKEELARAGRIEDDLTMIGTMRLQIDITEIDRPFLERYVKKIIILESGEEMSEKVWKQYGFDQIFGGEKPAEMAERKVQAIILYDLSPTGGEG